jgi:hypothetical protein
MQRILLAALVGGLVVFAWGAVSHMVLQLGELGISAAPAEAGTLAALQRALPEPGLYFLPSMQGMEPDQMPASGPAAFLAWRPEVSYGMGANLAIEFASGFLAALLAAVILGACGSSFTVLQKGVATMAMGLFGWLSICASYWTWYGFSDGFFLGEGIQQAVGWLLAGLAMGAVSRPRGGGS